MPPSGYELGMGEFVLPSLGIFIIGVCLVMLAGWLLTRSQRSDHRDTPPDPNRERVVAGAHLKQPPRK